MVPQHFLLLSTQIINTECPMHNLPSLQLQSNLHCTASAMESVCTLMQYNTLLKYTHTISQVHGFTQHTVPAEEAFQKSFVLTQ